MSHYIIGDVHGCGLELVELLKKINPKSHDRIILVGDVLDRACHGHLVMELIKQYSMDVLLGNHERKMLDFLSGRRSWIPPHYVWALNNLYASGVSIMCELMPWLSDLPLLLDLTDSNGQPFLVAHAGVNPENPSTPDVSYNVYGKLKEDAPMPRPKPGDRKIYWWDLYYGPTRVYYGHLVTHDGQVRIGKSSLDSVNSYGLDTAVCHGGPLTAICVETGEVIQHKSGTDWHAELKKTFHQYGIPKLDPWIVSSTAGHP